ncbi:MAG: hypothetical protein BZY88_02165, partial [SAR202 cluster bacterium Io17-Chloro-G9]
IALHFLAPQIVDYRVSGRMVSRKGNRSDTAAPHGAFPCAGVDQWCAIAVESDGHWEGLRRAMGDPQWSRDDRYSTTAGRLDHQDEIEGHLREWTGGKPPQEVMNLLLEELVPAGVVQRSSGLLVDSQLEHRRFFRYMDHLEMGNIPYTGHQFRIGGYDSGPRFPAPILGQHNEEVLREVLGMNDDEISEAIIAGALG